MIETPRAFCSFNKLGLATVMLGALCCCSVCGSPWDATLLAERKVEIPSLTNQTYTPLTEIASSNKVAAPGSIEEAGERQVVWPVKPHILSKGRNHTPGMQRP